VTIDELLARPGLTVRLRLLVLALIAVWRGDWPRLQEAVRTGRTSGVARADFEETLLQAVLFCGFPRAVTAFETLAAAWPAERPPAGGALPAEDQATAGRALFAAIYGQNEAAVRAMLLGYHRDFHDFVLEVAYGRVLARPGLTGRERELLGAGALAASDQLRQFAGHARGALHLGATKAELREVLVTVFGDVAQVDAWLQRVPAENGNS